MQRRWKVVGAFAAAGLLGGCLDTVGADSASRHRGRNVSIRVDLDGVADGDTKLHDEIVVAVNGALVIYSRNHTTGAIQVQKVEVALGGTPTLLLESQLDSKIAHAPEDRDLVLCTTEGVAILINGGRDAGTKQWSFTEFEVDAPTAAAPDDVGVGDLDDDKDLDLMVRSGTQLHLYQNKYVENGDSFTELTLDKTHENVPAGAGTILSITAEEISGDGMSDLVLCAGATTAKPHGSVFYSAGQGPIEAPDPDDARPWSWSAWVEQAAP